MLSLLFPFLIALLTFWSARGRTEPELHATTNLLRANLDNRIQINSNLDGPRPAVTAVKNAVMGPLSVKLLQSTRATSETSTNANTTTSDPSYRGGAMGGGAVAGLVICLVFVFLMGGFCYRRYRASGAAQRGGAKGYVVSEDDEIAIENPVHGGTEPDVRDSKKVLLNDLNL
jgi:hypothetical protein